MKLFIWTDPYPVSYGASLLFAVAETVEEARIQAVNGKSYSFGYEQDRGLMPSPLKEPDRIVDIPCAEWHEWSE